MSLGTGPLGVEPLGGNAGSGGGGSAVGSVIVSTTAAGRAGKSTAATRTVSLSASAAGALGLRVGATAALTVAALAAGAVVAGVSGNATAPLNVTTAAAGVVGRSTGAAGSITVSSSAAGALGLSRGASSALAISPTAVGVSGFARGAAPAALAITSTAAGSVYTGPTALADVVVEASADGIVTVPARTLYSWGNGRVRDGLATTAWEPPVAAPPKIQRAAYNKAQAIDSVTIAGTQAHLQVRTQAKRRPRHRIIVGGNDVTFFRDVEVPEPTIGLIEPLLWGSGSITWPQIHAAYENPGEGDLAWLKKEAPVRIQRVDPDTGDVVDTDFVGFIADYGNDGRALTTALAGKATGRASTSHRPQPIFPVNRDIGQLALQTLKHVLHLPTMDTAPDTGIVVPDSGDMWQLDFLTDLTARSTTLGGAQWTIMPDDDGVFRIFRKDTTTVDFTVYVDDTRSVANLRRDFAEEPNREFATAVADDGMRIRFGQYAGLTGSDHPPAFPGHLEQGDTGAGVLTLSWRLQMLGYLAGDQNTFATFTPALTKAVRRMQDYADLDVTGEVDASTWAAAFDNDRTGWSLRRAHIAPAAAKPYTRAFRTNASGQIIGRNPRYQRQVRHVDRAVDMGRVHDRQQAQDWAENDLVDQNTTNYVGTLELHMGAVIAGEHNPGDPLSTSNVNDSRWIRPGMNAWLPNYRGGLLIHVASVDHDGGVATLAVDTRARDALEVWEIHERNRSAIRHRARQWKHANRSSSLGRDAMTGWDEIGGTIDSRVTGPGGHWTVFPVVAGQEGQIRDLIVDTVNDPTEFVLAVFGKRITSQQLARLIGDPFTDDGKRAWRRQNDTLTDDHWLLYEAGWDDNPCGYHPSTKPDAAADFPDKSPDERVTGRFRDSAGFPYFCVDDPVLWVSFFPKNDTTIAPGRIMRVQLDDSV